MEYLDENCTKCRIEFTEEDWDLYLQQAPDEEVQKIQNSYFNDDPIMICCSKNWFDCQCDQPVDWDDTGKIPQDVWNKIYSDSFVNDCDICAYQYSEDCLPLRNFIVEFVRNGVIQEPIKICSDFYEDELVSNRGNKLMSINHGDF